MKKLDYVDLGNLFREYSMWGNSYLPRSYPNNKQQGVLWELLNPSENKNYKRYIKSLDSYCQNYQNFCGAYYANPFRSSKIEKPKYTCVPYWGKDFWKEKKRIAICAQKSLNRGSASIPLYFPLCEIKSWEKAFEIGLKLNEKQPPKPFGWHSFMMVWIAMRFIFSKNFSYLQQVYYSDIEKLDNKSANTEFLEKEVKIINPDLTILFGKTSHDKFESFFKQKKRELSFIYFPCGQGANNDLQAEQLEKCKNKLCQFLED